MGASRPSPTFQSEVPTGERDDTRHIRLAAEPGPAALDIFLAWLIWLPHDRDIATAAELEIRKIERSAAADRTMQQLRDMLEGVAQGRWRN
jgi:hypothetical protein